MHASSIVEWNRSARKMRQFTRFWRKLSAISLVLDIFRCLNAISIAFYTLNATNAVFSVETIPPVRRMRPFTRFWRHTERYFAFLEIFRRLYAISILLTHAECYLRQFHRRKKQTCAKNATICSILKKTVRYIAPVGDISTFKRYFHRILHSECYVCQLHRRMKQTCAKNATIYSILTTNSALLRYCWRYFAV